MRWLDTKLKNSLYLWRLSKSAQTNALSLWRKTKR